MVTSTLTSRLERQVEAIVAVCTDGNRRTEGLGQVAVRERCDNHQPLARRDIRCKRSVLIGSHVKPLVFSLVVHQEVVFNTVIRAVGEGSVHEVGVLEGNIDGILHIVQTDDDGIEELNADQVVIGGVSHRKPRFD